jgi:hypothetical protein
VVRGWRMDLRTGTSLNDLAQALIRREGLDDLYGPFGRNSLNRLLLRVHIYLTRWARRKY